ncbi:hypothetical protein [Rhodococcus sp. 27YEA15]|uniref:hypothetical protein n=1 Tax=Rhodococcus sp. 27YEA15 TaxID=3156259 RepID=UPI003C7D782D
MTVSTPQSRPTIRFAVLAAIGIVLLIALYTVQPDSPHVAVPNPVYQPAEWFLVHFDVTAVLTATTALAVVSMVRALPYGIGAILILGVGATLTAAASSSWLGAAPRSLLPSGHVAAATALYCSAVLIAAPGWRPAVLGLGSVGVCAVAACTIVTENSGLFGVIGGALVALVWACGAAAVMARSPVAAKREELRPDTAAMAFSRHRSIRPQC